MANPVNPGTLESWLALRGPVQVLNPKTGTSGDFESWLALRQSIGVYVKTAAAGPFPPFAEPMRTMLPILVQ